MQYSNYRTIFVAIGLIGVLLFASPTIVLLIKPPAGQEFSEIYLLGPNHTLENSPFNIKTGVSYLIYLGVTNNLESVGYYQCFLKIGNESNSFPNSTLGTPSSLPTLYEYKLFIANGATWEAPLTLQVNKLDIAKGTSQISDIEINGIDFPLNITSTWNPSKTGYYYRLNVELWLFNRTQGISQYNNRFVSLILNMTQ